MPCEWPSTVVEKEEEEKEVFGNEGYLVKGGQDLLFHKAHCERCVAGQVGGHGGQTPKKKADVYTIMDHRLDRSP